MGVDAWRNDERCEIDLNQNDFYKSNSQSFKLAVVESTSLISDVSAHSNYLCYVMMDNSIFDCLLIAFCNCYKGSEMNSLSNVKITLFCDMEQMGIIHISNSQQSNKIFFKQIKRFSCQNSFWTVWLMYTQQLVDVHF